MQDHLNLMAHPAAAGGHTGTGTSLLGLPYWKSVFMKIAIINIFYCLIIFIKLCSVPLVNTIFVTSILFTVSNIIFYAEFKNATRKFLSPINFLWQACLILLIPQITFITSEYKSTTYVQIYTHKYCIVHWKCRLGASKLLLLLLKLTCFLGTGSQTVQADSCTNIFRHEPRLCIRVTVLSVVSHALPCKHQKCFLFCSVKCVTSLCHSLVFVLLPLMPQKCLNHPDTFCCICGELTFKSQRRNFTH
jgi:hypothetical protein